MLRAALEDFTCLPDTMPVHTLVEQRFAFDNNAQMRLLGPEEDWRVVWLEEIRTCDAVLVIAPESDRELERLCADVHAHGRISLNCSIETIQLTTDKLALNQYLLEHGISAVPTQVWDSSQPVPKSGVLKPRDGAGSENTWRFPHSDFSPDADSETVWVWQPWLEGQAISLSLLINHEEVEILSYNKMKCVCENGCVEVCEIEVGALNDDVQLRQAGEQLVQDIQDAVPGLKGYIGVDAIWHQNKLTVLEINPRLTLPYAQLPRQRTKPLLAQRMLDVFAVSEAGS